MKISDNKAVPSSGNINRDKGKALHDRSPVSPPEFVKPSDDFSSILRAFKSRLPLVQGPGLTLPGKAVNSLLSFLTLLESIKPEPGNPDFLLASRFLSQWKKSYGEKLSGPAGKALAELEVFLRNSVTSETAVYLIGGPEREFGQWRLSVGDRERGEELACDGEEPVSCRLDLSTANLGDCSVVISEKKGKRFCQFSASIDSGRKILKKNMPRFKLQLEQQGVEPPGLSVLSSYRKSEPLVEIKKEGLDIWG
jgi:hypothetical protein